MKNRTLIVAALVMVLLCVGLIFLGLRHENAGGGSPGQSQTTDGQTADGDTQSQAQQDITATLAVCGDIMSHLPQTNDAYDAATDTYSYLPCFQYAKAWTESADYTRRQPGDHAERSALLRLPPVLRPGRSGLQPEKHRL